MEKQLKQKFIVQGEVQEELLQDFLEQKIVLLRLKRVKILHKDKKNVAQIYFEIENI